MNTTTDILDAAGDSDHDPILASIPLACKGFIKPGPDPEPLPRAPKLKTPVQQEHLQKYKTEFRLRMATQMQELNEELDSALHTAELYVDHSDLNKSLRASLAAGQIHAEQIERLSQSLQEILDQAIPISMETMTYTSGDSQRHRCRSRTVHRKLQILAKTRKVLHKAIKLHNEPLTRNPAQQKKSNVPENSPSKANLSDDITCSHYTCHVQLQSQIHQLLQEVPGQQRQELKAMEVPPAQASNQRWQQWADVASEERKIAQIQKEKIVQSIRRKKRDATRRHVQKAYAISPKQWHKRILKPNQGNVKLLSVRNKDTGKVINAPADITAYVHKAFQQQAEPVFGTKTGKYLPEDVRRDYPWSRSSALDPYTLETDVGKQGLVDIELLKLIKDPNLFQRHLQKLPNRKSPGPDCIPNELLKHLPEEVQQAMHKMFILMWMTGHTPKAWKESCTILIHKKGDEQDISNWRPIALANTLYKLWTGIVTECLTTYAEEFNLLSSSQEGFRAGKNTIRQLQNVMNVMSDAKLCRQDLFVLYVDFSSAFNTIDHDKLLQIMYDLGFPTSAKHHSSAVSNQPAWRVQSSMRSIPLQSNFVGSSHHDTPVTALCDLPWETLHHLLEAWEAQKSWYLPVHEHCG